MIISCPKCGRWCELEDGRFTFHDSPETHGICHASGASPDFARDMAACEERERALKATPQYGVWFSPNGGCQAELISMITSAKTSIFVATYSFTSKTVVQALINAKNNGRTVGVILDRIHAYPSPSPTALALAPVLGNQLLIDLKHVIMHDKFTIIDQKYVLTGSYNYTEQAEHQNAENLVKLVTPSIVAAFKANWDLHASHSIPLSAVPPLSAKALEQYHAASENPESEN